MSFIYFLFLLPYEGKGIKNSFMNDYPYFGYDMLKYELTLYLPMNSNYLEGTARLKLKAEEDLDTLTFMLYYMDCDEVRIGGTSRYFLYNHSRIDIPYSLSRGDTVEVSIDYHGNPIDGFYFYDSDEEEHITAFTFTEPSDSRYWFPCFDHPSDKALFEAYVEVPYNFVVASNGVLLSVDTTDTTLIYHWKEDYPIATYLISLAIAPYTVVDTQYVSITGDTVDIKYYLYEDHLTDGLEVYKNLFSMLSFFEQKFGAYPFKKYGMAEVFNMAAAGMEHQTITTLNAKVITEKWEDVVVHELAHQWWGDMVTLEDWPDIWLNEGFATYSEALFYEDFKGEDYFQSLMSARKLAYFKDNIGPIYDPVDLFSWGTVYCKGSWVLHMLRGITGDSIFFNILKEYGEQYRYSNATTEDFKNVVEEVYGKDMDWFFNQWIYRGGHPVYDTTFHKEGDSVYLTISQVQKEGPFKMPLGILLLSKDTSLNYTVWDSLSTQDFVFYFPFPLKNIVIDPDSVVLKEIKCSCVEQDEISFHLEYLPEGIKVYLESPQKIYVYTMDGRLKREYYHGNMVFIDYSDYRTGIYFIKTEDGNSAKFMVIK